MATIRRCVRCPTAAQVMPNPDRAPDDPMLAMPPGWTFTEGIGWRCPPCSPHRP